MENSLTMFNYYIFAINLILINIAIPYISSKVTERSIEKQSMIIYAANVVALINQLLILHNSFAVMQSIVVVGLLVANVVYLVSFRVGITANLASETADGSFAIVLHSYARYVNSSAGLAICGLVISIVLAVVNIAI